MVKYGVMCVVEERVILRTTGRISVLDEYTIKRVMLGYGMKVVCYHGCLV